MVSLLNISPAVGEATEAFIKQFYSREAFIPWRILVSEPVADADPLAAWISDLAERKVTIHHPVRGEKRRLVELAVANAKNLISQAEQGARQHRPPGKRLEYLGGVAQMGHSVVGLVVVLIVTMTLSDLMNNAATAAVMCPIAISTASQLGASVDPFLMAVAVGASCAFLTPIGHQNNTLILGPGGLRFGDYWRLGLPLEILVIVVAIPMLLLVWPL